jgi:hypothetical protein
MGLLMKILPLSGGRLVCTTLAISILVASMVVPMVGCGDDAPATSPFENTYQVLVHTRNNDDCESEGTPFEGDDYFKLAESDGSLSYQTCEAGDACTGSLNTSKSFESEDSEGWRDVDINATDIRLGCDVALTERTARLNAGDLRIEQRTYEGEINREQGADCTDSLILDSRGELTCKRYEVVVAVPTQ